MDEQTKARLLAAVEAIKNFCDATPCGDCPFEDAMFCAFDGSPCNWDIVSVKERLSHDQTDTPRP